MRIIQRGDKLVSVPVIRIHLPIYLHQAAWPIDTQNQKIQIRREKITKHYRNIKNTLIALSKQYYTRNNI